MNIKPSQQFHRCPEGHRLSAARAPLAVAVAGVLAMLVAVNARSAEGDPAGPTAKEDTQGDTAQQSPGSGLEEIVVTGTQMRGVAPTGTALIDVGKEDIAASGAVTTAELLSTIPQVNSFGTIPAVLGGNNVQLTVNRVNLRNLPQGIGASSPTLVLMDGHRLVGVGVGQNYPDPDVVPPAVIERVEILTDGGSSVYGADAVGGVVNFITRKDYEGAEVNLRQGFGDSYYSTDASATVGDNWGRTSAYVSYDYTQHDAIYGSDRGYAKDIDWTTGLPQEKTCTPANVAIGSDSWTANPGGTLTPGASLCDTSEAATIYPDEQRHSILGGFRADLADSVELNVKTWYTTRENTSDEGPIFANAQVTSANPNYISTGGATGAATQTVGFDFAPVNGTHTDQTTELDEWGITPSLTLEMGHDWAMRAFYNYGYSESEFSQSEANAHPSLASLVTDGAINPYNTAASDPAAIATVFGWEQYGYGEDEMHNARLVFDGPVFELPGGAIHVAIGAEYLDESYKGKTKTGTSTDISATPWSEADRDVTAMFAELNVPIVGDSNRFTGVYELTFAASFRRDDYSDFGTADSPNLALTWKPMEWLTLRGRQNEAFQAPGLADLANSNSTVNSRLFRIAVIENPYAAPWDGNSEGLVSMEGTKLPLSPQEADIFNVGFDIEVPFVEGLELGASYYQIEYEGQISIPPIFQPTIYYRDFPDNYLMRPTSAEAESFLQSRGVDQTEIDSALATVDASGKTIYAVVDVLRTNLGFNKYQGYDVFASYYRNTSFGSVTASFNGTFVDLAESQVAPGLPVTDTAGIDSSDFNYTFSLTAQIGDHILTQATLYHVSDFPLSVPVGLGQDEVDSFDTVDLYAQYDFSGGGWTEGLALSLGLNNVFDEDPPIYRGTTQGNTNGYSGGTLGRVLQLGISKDFSL